MNNSHANLAASKPSNYSVALMKGYVFSFHYQTKTDLKFTSMLKLKTKSLAFIYRVGMTTSVIFDCGKPVSIKSLFNIQNKSLLLTILFTSIHLACAISLTLVHNSACRALLNVSFYFFVCINS